MKVVVYTNIPWMIAMFRGDIVIPQEYHSMSAQDNSIPTEDDAARIDHISDMLRRKIQSLRSFGMRIRTVMLEQHLYYDIPFASPSMITMRTGLGDIPLGHTRVYITRKIYAEGGYIFLN